MATFLAASNPGVVTAIKCGSTNITAKMQGYAGILSATSQMAVTAASGSSCSQGPLYSITILPTTLTTENLYGTGQFLAYGSFSTPPTLLDITNGFRHIGFPATCIDASLPAATCPLISVDWISAMPNIFPVNSSGATGGDAGLVTAAGSGTADIYVTTANPDGTLVNSSTATFNCPYVKPTYDSNGNVTDVGTCNALTIVPAQLVTLTIYNAGLNTTNWLVTAPSATGTPDVINCGPGALATGNAGAGVSVCSATYPVGTTLTVTAPAQTGVAFGGWSDNCTATTSITASGPNSCQIVLGDYNSSLGFYVASDESVGAVFNNSN